LPITTVAALTGSWNRVAWSSRTVIGALAGDRGDWAKVWPAEHVAITANRPAAASQCRALGHPAWHAQRRSC
ncbi:MAG: hypothetical protein WBF47_01635, partial [Xanthobacteraceae bacterium]